MRCRRRYRRQPGPVRARWRPLAQDGVEEGVGFLGREIVDDLLAIWRVDRGAPDQLERIEESLAEAGSPFAEPLRSELVGVNDELAVLRSSAPMELQPLAVAV